MKGPVSASAVPIAPTGWSLTERAEMVIQSAILAGELLPDARLTIPGLIERFGIGATPIREALSRLVTKGLVTLTENKGFRVASASRADLEDITATRCIVETTALKLSMERHEATWEDGVVASIHRYRREALAAGNVLMDGNEAFDAAHRAFHVALIAGCGLKRLLDIQSTLYDQAYRYRRLMVAGGLDTDWGIGEHQRLADLALAGRMDEACRALEAHLHLTLEHVYPEAHATSPAEAQPQRAAASTAPRT
jgi:GntR family transcriptional regulator, carbon starvation induced regulator